MINEAGFYCDIVFPGDGSSFMIVRIPSTKEQFKVELDAELRNDCTEIVNELIETVTQDALALQECECEHDQSLRRVPAWHSEANPEEDHTWWGCGQCGRCSKCHRRIRGSEFSEHAWWCVNDKYRPITSFWQKRPTSVKAPNPQQMTLF